MKPQVTSVCGSFDCSDMSRKYTNRILINPGFALQLDDTDALVWKDGQE